MSEIEKQIHLKRENLNEAHYVESLLYEAANLDLIKQDETNDILMQSIPLLAKQTERYTKGKSSSVRVENAQSILQSLLYTVGVCLKNLPDAGQSLTMLKETPLEELFEQGKTIIAKEILSAKRLLRTANTNSIVTSNIAYNDTLFKGLHMFFALYDADFAAHETPGSIDYPLAVGITNLTGIEYIHQYLKILYIENQFCRKFGSICVDNLLDGYSPGSRNLLINIYEQALINALGCELRRKNLLVLHISEADRQYLQQDLEKLTAAKLREVLLSAALQVCHKLGIADGMLHEHITQSVDLLVPRLQNVLENKRLESFFISMNNSKPQEADVKIGDAL